MVPGKKSKIHQRCRELAIDEDAIGHCQEPVFARQRQTHPVQIAAHGLMYGMLVVLQIKNSLVKLLYRMMFETVEKEPVGLLLRHLST